MTILHICSKLPNLPIKLYYFCSGTHFRQRRWRMSWQQQNMLEQPLFHIIINRLLLIIILKLYIFLERGAIRSLFWPPPSESKHCA